MSDYPSLQNMPGVSLRPTKCELDGVFGDNLHPVLEKMLESYPTLLIDSDSIRPSYSKETIKSAFLPKNESTGVALLSQWREEGVPGVLGSLKESPRSQISWLAGVLLAVWRIPSSLQTFFYPHLRLSPQEMLSTFCLTRDWFESPVRCLAWHPHTRKLAVVSRDDCVRIGGNGAKTKPILRHTGQRGISCLSWKPCGSAELAVGCRVGIMLWTLDPASVVSRPSTSCVRPLIQPGHAPVITLAWHPAGKLLASGSPADPTMLIWSVASEQCAPVRRVSGGGISLLRWSAGGSRLLAATPGRTFRVWNTKSWKPERWTVPGLESAVACAAWSADSNHLVFATSDEPLLYAVSFISETDSAVPVLDLSEVIVDSGCDLLGGGLAQNIVWEPAGHRLAVAFRSTPLVAVFSTRTGRSLSLTPCGWIRGAEDEFATCLEFEADFSEGGAVLTVGWSSGRVQHVPLLYSPVGLQATKVEILSTPELFTV